jgi:hypothetical protein
MKAFLAFLVVFISRLALLLIIAHVLSGANDRTYTRVAVYHYHKMIMSYIEPGLAGL